MYFRERYVAKARDQVGRGREADLSDDCGKRRKISAEEVRTFCIGDVPGHQRDAGTPVHLRGAEVVGLLNLRDAVVTRRLRFSSCIFHDGIDMRGLHTAAEITFDEDTEVSFLDAQEMTSSSDFIVRDSTVMAGLHLVGARIEGTFRCAGTTLGPSTAEGTCLNARNLQCGGDLVLGEGFVGHGEINLQWVHVRSLRASGASLNNPGRCALRADGLHAADDVFLDDGFTSLGAVTLVGARLGDELRCTRGKFYNKLNPTADNLQCRALDVERIEANDIYMDRDFRAEGEVRLVGAQLETQLNCTSGNFVGGDGSYALNADALNVGGEVFFNGDFYAEGEVRLVGATIGREFNCSGGEFWNPSGIAINADGLTTEGSVYLNKDEIDDDVSGKREVQFTAVGRVRLARATVGRQLDCSGGKFSSLSPGPALDITGLVGKGDTRLESADMTGGIRLRGATIDRDLNCKKTILRNDAHCGADNLFDAANMSVGGIFFWSPELLENRMSVDSASVAQLFDDIEKWPGIGKIRWEDSEEYKDMKKSGAPVSFCERRRKRKEWLRKGGDYDLAEFSYGYLDDTDVEKRERWLRWALDFTVAPWGQLVSYYRQRGEEENARRIVIFSHAVRRVRGGLAWHTRAWDWFVGKLTGYGYRMELSLWWIIGIWAIVGIPAFYFAQDQGIMHPTHAPEHTKIIAGHCGDSDYPCFIFWLYPLELLMPVLNLWLVGYWLPWPGTGLGWFYLILTLLFVVTGWSISIALVAGVRHLLKSELSA